MPRKRPTCEHDDCQTRPTFDIKGGKGRFCRLHKTAIMIDVISKHCIYDGCNSQPSFNVKGELPLYCRSHKKANMINVKHKHCEYDDCEILCPSFDIIGGKGRFCVTHKSEDMVDVRHKKCEAKGCNILPSFNTKGLKNARFCYTHKTEDMIDVVSNICESLGCNIRATYNIQGGKGRFCVTHKTVGMIDVVSKQCESSGCNLKANYDINGGKGRFCVTHKTTDMINIYAKYCEAKDCNSQPTFGIKGGKRQYCLIHKLTDMIDISHIKCDEDGCESRSRYGILGHIPSYCAKHRKIGMIRHSNAKCSECNEPAIWGINWTPRHCEIHKSSDDENLVERPCTSCGLSLILDKDNKCEYCNPESFARATLAKQNAIMEYLNMRNLKGNSTDKIIEGGNCGMERPDRIYDFGDKILIFECDENKHEGRACTCEQARMVNIGQSFGGLPVYFIRWNPDNYEPYSNNSVEDIKKRYKLLGDFITDIKENRVTLPNALVSALYMYYDNWSSLAEEEWQVITPYAKNEIVYPE